MIEPRVVPNDKITEFDKLLNHFNKKNGKERFLTITQELKMDVENVITVDGQVTTVCIPYMDVRNITAEVEDRMICLISISKGFHKEPTDSERMKVTELLIDKFSKELFHLVIDNKLKYDGSHVRAFDVDEVGQMPEIDKKLSSMKRENNRGVYSRLVGLIQMSPEGQDGWYAYVVRPNRKDIYAWIDGDWERVDSLDEIPYYDDNKGETKFKSKAKAAEAFTKHLNVAFDKVLTSSPERGDSILVSSADFKALEEEVKDLFMQQLNVW